jgi:hypothetical protein
MVLKLIIRYVSNKDPFSRLFHLASVDYKDDINVLQETVLDRIGEAYENYPAVESLLSTWMKVMNLFHRFRMKDVRRMMVQASVCVT